MRQHYTLKPRRYPLADIALAVAIGAALALALVAWWSA